MTVWNHILPRGGKLSEAPNVSYSDEQCKVARGVPGPGQYHIKRDLQPSGGRFNLSNAKTDVEWQMIRAAKLPGPGEYPVHVMDPRTISGARIQGGKFDESRPMNDVEWKIHNNGGAPGPGEYDVMRPPKMAAPAGGRFNLAQPKSELDFLLDQARKMPGPGEYDAPRWPCPSEGRFSGQQAGVKMDMYRQSPFPKQHVPRVKSGHQTLVTKQDSFGHKAGLEVSRASRASDSMASMASFQMIGQPDVSFAVPRIEKFSQTPMLSPIGFAAFKQIFAYLDKEKAKVMDLFYTIDKDGSGELDAWEFQAALEEMGLKLKQHEVIEVMKEIDHDFDGSIDVAEFLARLREELKRFRIMDVDHDGDVTLEEYNEFVLAQRSANERKLALTAGHTTNASMNSSSRSNSRLSGQGERSRDGGKPPGSRALFRTQKGMLPSASAQLNERDKMRADLAASEKKLPPTAPRGPDPSVADTSASTAGGGGEEDGAEVAGEEDPVVDYSKRLALARPALNPRLHPVDWGAPQSNNANNTRFMRAVQEAGEDFATHTDLQGRAADQALKASRRLEQQERREEAAGRIRNRRSERSEVETSIKTMFVKTSRSLSTLPVQADISLNKSIASLSAGDIRNVADNSALGKGYVLPTKHLAGPTHRKRAEARVRAARRRAKVSDRGDLADLDRFDSLGAHMRDYSIAAGPWPNGIKPSRAPMGGRVEAVQSMDDLLAC